MTPWEQILRRVIAPYVPAGLGRHSLRLYQRVSVKLMKDTLQRDKPSGLILALEPGAGKTVSFLTAARDLLDEGLIRKVLIIAPLLVANTVWAEEIETWLHLKRTTYSICTGTEKQRIAALETDAEVYIINKDVLPWLWDYLGRGDRWDFDFVGIDEASMLKNGKKRTKLKKLTRFGVLAAARKHIKGVVELTGTPSPNGLVNLWGLAYIADQGARLGRTKSSFMERWFDFNKYTYEVKAKPYAEEQILSALGDIMFSLDPKDYAELPPMVENVIRVPLPPKVMDEYRRFKRTLVSEQYDVEAVNAAVLTNKLCQFANSSMFNEDGEEVWIHDCKLDALKNLHAEVGGTPLLVAYSFTFDKRRIQKEFPKAVVLNEVPDVMQTVRDWNAGKIDMLLAHRASAGHGLNLQKGSSIFVSYGLTADLELWQQFNKRLHRPGQKADRVWHHIIVAKDTHDEDILPVLQDKKAVQDRVFEATRLILSDFDA